MNTLKYYQNKLNMYYNALFKVNDFKYIYPNKSTEYVEDFSELMLTCDEKEFVKNSSIHEINYPYPGKGYSLWKYNHNSRYYVNGRHIKVWHKKIRQYSTYVKSE
jgi:hypothetical protein